MSDPKEEVARLSSLTKELRARLEEMESELARHRRPNEVLDRSEQRFRTIFDHSNDAIFLVDVGEDAILDVNDKACRMLGYSREELLGIPMSVIHPHEMGKVRAFARSVIEEKQGFTDELTCLTKSGTTLAAEISGSILQMEDRTCMIASVRDVTERNRLASENEYLNREIRRDLGFGSIIGDSPEMRAVLEQIEQVAPTDASVLVTGESGTGKELVARAIHEHSRRRERTLVRVNCASIPTELFESEFFGHVKGAFTSAVKDRPGRFELADRGTIFLDEIGEIPQRLQSKLLRVLQEGELERVGENRTRKIDVRIIAATNRNLAAEVEEGRFREDLYYRLSVFPIEVPPLRNRPQDIAPLAEHCVKELCKRLGKPNLRLSRDQIKLLGRQPWAGNVRELQNALERGAILAKGDQLVLDRPPGAPMTPSTGLPDRLLSGQINFAQFERQLLVLALQRNKGNQSQTAKMLGMSRRTVQYRIEKFAINRTEMQEERQR